MNHSKSWCVHLHHSHSILSISQLDAFNFPPPNLKKGASDDTCVENTMVKQFAVENYASDLSLALAIERCSTNSIQSGAFLLLTHPF
jgi:hypothetical protein